MLPISDYATDEVLEAMLSLSGNEDWENFLLWLDITFAKMTLNHIQDVTRIDTSPAQNNVDQGRCLILWELKTLADRAKDILSDKKIKEAIKKEEEKIPVDEMF